MNFKQYLTELSFKEKLSIEVQSYLTKKFKNSAFIFDEKLWDGAELEFDSSKGKLKIYYQESRPVQGKKVYEYNFEFID